MRHIENESSMELWESFIVGDPIIQDLIEEAKLQQVDSDDDPDASVQQEKADPSQSEDVDLNELAQKLASGEISEDDLVKEYQAGNLSKDEIQQILQLVEQGGSPQEDVDPEELLAQQIDQLNDNFIRFSIYDKIIELQSKLDNFLENFTMKDTGFYQEIERAQEFLNILSSLAFSIDVSVLYQMYGSIELKLIDSFTEYSKKQKAETGIENSLEKIQKQASADKSIDDVDDNSDNDIDTQQD